MKLRHLVFGIVAVILVITVTYLLLVSNNDWTIEGEKIGTIDHEVIILLNDSSIVSVGNEYNIFAVLHNNKRVTSITYSIEGHSDTNGISDLTQFHPYFSTPLGRMNLDLNDASFSILNDGFSCSWELLPEDFLNFSLEDGDYNITLCPSGTIMWNSETTNLPDNIEFKLRFEDRRSVILVFG